MYLEMALATKMRALKQLGKYVGLWGPLRKPVEELPPPPVPLYLILLRIFDETAHPVQRHAAAMLFEVYRPGWRAQCPPELLGEIVERDSPEVVKWRKAVLHRDSGRCRGCGSSQRLHAHHIAPWAEAPELRLIVENGITVCADCHAEQHPDIANFVRSV